MRFCALRIFLVALVGTAIPSAHTQTPSEYAVKAAFVFNFAKFVEWPATAFRNNQSPVTICVVGEDPFGKMLDDTIKGQTVGSRGYAVRRVAQIPRDDSCQIAFLGASEKGRAEQTLGAIKGLPILTVGDRDDMAETGNMIAFLIEENRVRFEINLDIAELAGLKISSRLLKLAKTVHERRKN